MNGWETKSDLSIDPWTALAVFCLPLPVDVSLSSRHVETVHISRDDETHKVEQPQGRD